MRRPCPCLSVFLRTANMVCYVCGRRRILTNFIKHKYQLMQQFEHIDNSSAMLLPNHPRDSKGNPIVPELKFGPNSAVRTAGEAMGVYRRGHGSVALMPAHVVAACVLSRRNASRPQRATQQARSACRHAGVQHVPLDSPPSGKVVSQSATDLRHDSRHVQTRLAARGRS